MRIACYGSLLFPICAALREHSDIDVQLFLDSNALSLQMSHRDERLIREADWIHVGPYTADRWLVGPWAAPLVRDLREFDQLWVSDLGPLFGQFTGRPMYFFPAGGDLTVTPFAWRARHLRKSVRDLAAASVIAAWQRRGIRRVREVWAPPFSPYCEALRWLGIEESRRSREYFPVAINDRLFHPDDDAGRATRDRYQIPSDAFVVLHPSRLMMDPRPFHVATGQWKRNEVLIEGMGRLIASNRVPEVLLVLLDLPYSPDRARARQMCAQLGIEHHVRWIAPDGPSFTWSQMRDLYAMADVIADDFGVGWFGLVMLEAMAVGRPVLGRLDEGVMRQLYPWHPMRSADDPDSVASELAKLAEDPRERQALGLASRHWIEEFHSDRAIAKRYSDAAVRRET